MFTGAWLNQTDYTSTFLENLSLLSDIQPTIKHHLIQKGSSPALDKFTQIVISFLFSSISGVLFLPKSVQKPYIQLWSDSSHRVAQITCIPLSKACPFQLRWHPNCQWNLAVDIHDMS